MRKRTAKFWVNLCRIQKSQNPQMSTVNPPLLQPIIHVWHIRGKVHTGISSSLHCYYISSTLFWRDVTWIRHLIAVNINFWALCWCNFLSQSGKISDLGCRRERPPPSDECRRPRLMKLWMAVVSLQPLACYKWNDHACTSMLVHTSLLLPFPPVSGAAYFTKENC